MAPPNGGPSRLPQSPPRRGAVACSSPLDASVAGHAGRRPTGREQERSSRPAARRGSTVARKLDGTTERPQMSRRA